MRANPDYVPVARCGDTFAQIRPIHTAGQMYTRADAVRTERALNAY